MHKAVQLGQLTQLGEGSWLVQACYPFGMFGNWSRDVKGSNGDVL